MEDQLKVKRLKEAREIFAKDTAMKDCWKASRDPKPPPLTAVPICGQDGTLRLSAAPADIHKKVEETWLPIF
jgi:hypothetical protein